MNARHRIEIAGLTPTMECALLKAATMNGLNGVGAGSEFAAGLPENLRHLVAQGLQAECDVDMDDAGELVDVVRWYLPTEGAPQ